MALTPEPIKRDEIASETGNGAVPGWVQSYSEADVEVPILTPIHELPITQLADVVISIVNVESPVHEDEVTRRVVKLWCLERTGSRITIAVASAIRSAVWSRKIVEDDGFLTKANQAEIPVRNRERVNSSSLRKPEMLPVSEIRAAIRRLITENVGARRDEVRSTVAKALGFRSTSAQLRDIIEGQFDKLALNGGIVERDGKLFVPDA